MGSEHFIGCHLSAAKGFVSMGKNALQIGANTFQFFTRNPQGGRAKDLDLKDVEAFLKMAQEYHFGPIVAHAPYTLNPCSADLKTLEFAEMVFCDDLKRMAFLPFNYYNFHPGSHVGQGVEKGIELISRLLNKVLKQGQNTTVLLETMSGKGTEIGARFEELRAILERLDRPEKIGVCLDSCHVWSAGYDLVHDLNGVLKEFDAVLGLKRLKAIHLNDSKTPFASRKDRHEKIGQGSLGKYALLQLVKHPKLQGLPFILETPNDLEGYQKEIAFLKAQADLLRK